jgi:epsilon-lactone hydrolase
MTTVALRPSAIPADSCHELLTLFTIQPTDATNSHILAAKAAIMRTTFPVPLKHIVYIAAAFTVALVIARSVLAADDSTFPPREVTARSLPVPTTASPELQQVIAAAPRANAAPVPQNTDQWRFAQIMVNGPAIDRDRALAKQLNVTVTPTTVAGVPCFQITPSEVLKEHQGRILVNVHGGAFVFFGGEAGTREGIMVAHYAKTPVLAIDYRMPPDHPFPAALDDTVAVWTEVIKNHKPSNMALFGTSAGGGLTMSAVLKLKQSGIPLPGALFIGTPASDLTKTGDSFYTNDGVDNVLVDYGGAIAAALKLYAGDNDLKDPLLSPIYGDLHGFPPSILFSGTRDLLLSNTVRAHRKLRQSGVEADLHVFEGQSHAQYFTYPSPEADDAFGEIAKFFDRHLSP